MQEFKLYIFNQFWSDGFKFVNDPAIEVINNFDTYEMYEKPHLDFEAYGDLSIEFELAQIRDYCAVEPIKIYQNNEVIWNGSVRLSDVKSVFNGGNGSYKTVEVIDSNLNRYFKNREKLKVEIDSVWDLLCNRIIPPNRNTYYFESGTDSPRQMYLFTDVLYHVIDIITEGEVNVVSNFFTNTDAQNWLFGTGDQIALELSGNFLPFVTWDDLTDFLEKTYRLFRYHYQIDGVNYVRIEPFDYFFNSSSVINYDAVSNVNYGTKLDKLYSTTIIGDAREIDDDVYDSDFIDFEFDSFDQQTVGISGSCGSGGELDLGVRSIYVDTEKIEFCLNVGDTDFTYRKDLFVVESDGTNATLFNKGNYTYYNDSFLNSSILKRWFNGSSPITVFPENFASLNYFSISQSGTQSIGKLISGSVTDAQLSALNFVGDEIGLDPDNTLSSITRVNTLATSSQGDATASTQATKFTCSKSGSYQIDIDWNVAAFGGLSSWTQTPNIKVYAYVKHYSATNIELQDFTSPRVEVSAGSVFMGNKIDWRIPIFAMASGDYLVAYLRSDVIPNVVAGTLGFGISGGSSISAVPCSTFVVDKQVGGKQFIYETEFQKYPLSEDNFNAIRLNPGIKQRITSYKNEVHTFSGYIENLKHNLITSETDVKITGSDPQKSFGLTMTSSNMKFVVVDGIYYDSNFWIDDEVWID